MQAEILEREFWNGDFAGNMLYGNHGNVLY